MSSRFSQSLRRFLRGLSRVDIVALAISILYVVRRAVEFLGGQFPFAGLIGFFFFLSAVYLSFRLFQWARTKLLWSLRNRLIVAYLFIAVVPIVLLVSMAGVSAYILYVQLGGHLFHDDLDHRIERVGQLAELIASLPPEPATSSVDPRRSTPKLVGDLSMMVEAAARDLPGLEVKYGRGEEILKTFGKPVGKRFTGLQQDGGRLWLTGIVQGAATGARSVVTVRAPMTAELLGSLVPEIGRLDLILTEPTDQPPPNAVNFTVAGRRFTQSGNIAAKNRSLPAPTSFVDFQVTGFSQVDTIFQPSTGGEPVSIPVFVSFTERPSQLNRRLFSSLGELRDIPVTILLFTGGFFFIIEVAALIVGVVLTRTITRAVADLYRGTERVKSADLTYRVRIPQKDQLGALGDSFNAMTGSIAELLEEQRRRQRLENELAIAQEVQSQLFPQSLPTMSGIELAAICRAARTVSGDYYDFIRVSPRLLVLVVADISGKGISAALLMASLQAAVRSLVLLEGAEEQSTAELVRRLNLHLFRNSSSERYATFFYAIYDNVSRTLRYTNAGHLPPLLVSGDSVQQLDKGGMVVGLFEHADYEQGTLAISPGSVLVAYSDGLTEPENVYGEEFGPDRLKDAVIRHRAYSPKLLADSLMNAADEWAGSPEQGDDMTVIVARMA
ncbi:MAG: SpoIIE family protein phosphatase [Acidobacteria bacterium]|nr:SpoIIE family protein phosphatase [Acidobacteriota bacterium]